MGPNGLGKTVLADAVRFTLGSNMTSVRVKAAKEAINHQLLQSQGSKAACSTEVGFVISRKKQGDSPSTSEPRLYEDIRYLRVRRRVLATGQSTYYAACWATLPGSDCLQDHLTSQPYVCSRSLDVYFTSVLLFDTLQMMFSQLYQCKQLQHHGPEHHVQCMACALDKEHFKECVTLGSYIFLLLFHHLGSIALKPLVPWLPVLPYIVIYQCRKA